VLLTRRDRGAQRRPISRRLRPSGGATQAAQIPQISRHFVSFSLRWELHVYAIRNSPNWAVTMNFGQIVWKIATGFIVAALVVAVALVGL